MSNLVILFIHFIATLARWLGPGGVRSIVAESLILKHQLLIVNRSRQRSPNLCTSDRILAGLRSEEHTSELQSRRDLVCRLLLEKKKAHPVHYTTDGQKHFVRPAVIQADLLDLPN